MAFILSVWKNIKKILKNLLQNNNYYYIIINVESIKIKILIK
ncbi:hypothetical protein CSCA_3665 [Clostridium scatologenes]|uniref:Uncharacterized protein n=1 Tax=Clostridium scatologenes TaxID=1548 RepID=A0A0E3M7U8_CLOSL|nr:hypothetical protein CSCA_3665 [Clostridium scatologenes]